MHGNRADGIVNVELVVEQPHAKDHQQTGNHADGNRAEAIGHVAAGRDADQTRKGGV